MADLAERLGGRPAVERLGAAVPIADGAVELAHQQRLAGLVHQRGLVAQLALDLPPRGVGAVEGRGDPPDERRQAQGQLQDQQARTERRGEPAGLLPALLQPAEQHRHEDGGRQQPARELGAGAGRGQHADQAVRARREQADSEQKQGRGRMQRNARMAVELIERLHVVEVAQQRAQTQQGDGAGQRLLHPAARARPQVQQQQRRAAQHKTQRRDLGHTARKRRVGLRFIQKE